MIGGKKQDKHAAGPAAGLDGQQRRVSIGRWLLVAGGVIAVAVAFLAGQYASQQSDRADTAQLKRDQARGQRNAIAAEMNSLADEMIEVCRAGGDAAVRLRSLGLCSQAREAKTTAVDPPVVDAVMVRRIVEEYLRANPGRSPSASDILPVVRGEVARVLEANPPEDGEDAEPPSDERLLGLINQVYAANPPADGADGQTPPCFFTERQCEGLPGVDGTNGVNGVDAPVQVEQRLEQVDGDCRLITVFQRADGMRFELDADAAEICPGQEPGPGPLLGGG